jgi:hypothetical protein
MRNSGDACLAKRLGDRRGTGFQIEAKIIKIMAFLNYYSCSLELWNVDSVEIRGRRLKTGAMLFLHGVLAQGDCSCVVKRHYGDEENVIIG